MRSTRRCTNDKYYQCDAWSLSIAISIEFTQLHLENESCRGHGHCTYFCKLVLFYRYLKSYHSPSGFQPAPSQGVLVQNCKCRSQILCTCFGIVLTFAILYFAQEQTTMWKGSICETCRLSDDLLRPYNALGHFIAWKMERKVKLSSLNKGEQMPQ